MNFANVVDSFINSSGIYLMTWKSAVMILLSLLLLYLAVGKKFEPLLLIPMSFGMLLANLPGSGVMHPELFLNKNFSIQNVMENGGLIDFLYLGIKLGVYPPLIFLGIGAMTDFTSLIANPKTLLLGAAAQLGIFCAFIFSLSAGFLGSDFAFSLKEGMTVGILGGADGPSSILVAKTLAPHLLPAVSIAAYSYMALIPIIQPPVMRALTTKKERSIIMPAPREVSKKEKILFPVIVSIVVILILPASSSLVGMLMLGNLLKESGVADRLVATAQNGLINVITVLLALSVGATASGETFLTPQTILIVLLGFAAFALSTVGGVLFGKLMCYLTDGKINPLIGAAGVSAVPMAARIAQLEGQRENPNNFLLMHAMGPNVAGVIASAVVAGVFLSISSLL